jgi:hypothetical protein
MIGISASPLTINSRHLELYLLKFYDTNLIGSIKNYFLSSFNLAIYKNISTEPF